MRTMSVLGAIAALWAVGCLYDEDGRCGDHQVYDPASFSCLCVAGAVAAVGGCEPCGAHELVVSNQCVCDEGFGRDGSGACVAQPDSALGDPCNTTDMPCVDEVVSFCALETDTEGYCTSAGCVSNDDCESGFTCVADGNPSYCARPPSGQGMSCASSADCEGLEASYCDTFMTRTCLVQGCSLEPDDCSAGYGCCDLSMFGVGLLCIPEQQACPFAVR